MKDLSSVKWCRRALAVCSFFCALSLFSMFAEARPGDLDTMFGSGGRVMYNPTARMRGYCATYPCDNNPVSLSLESSGKYIVGGNTWGGYIERLNRNGNLDSVLVGRDSFHPYISDVAIQPDGKILNIYQSTFLQRLSTDGSSDTTFGTSYDGAVELGFGFTDDTWDEYRSSQRQIIFIQRDGKIIRTFRTSSWDAGCRPTTYGRNGTDNASGWALMRFDSHGSHDPSFGVPGIGFGPREGGFGWDAVGAVETCLGDPRIAPDTFVQLPDDKLLIAGGSDGIERFVIVRYNSNGTVDTNFAASDPRTNIFEQNIPNGSVVKGIGILPDGSYLRAFVDNSGGPGNEQVGLVHITSDGRPGNRFGGSSILRMRTPNILVKMFRLMENGTLLFIGDETSSANSRRSFALLEFSPDGIPIDAFGEHGKVSTDFGANTSVEDYTIHQLVPTFSSYSLNSSENCELTLLGRNLDNGYTALARYLVDCSWPTGAINISPNTTIPSPPQIIYQQLPPVITVIPPDPKNTVPLNTQLQNANAPKPASVAQPAPVQVLPAQQPSLMDKVSNFFKK